MAYSDGKVTPTKLIAGKLGDSPELSFESAFWTDQAGILIRIGEASSLITRKQFQEVCTLFPFKEKADK